MIRSLLPLLALGASAPFASNVPQDTAPSRTVQLEALSGKTTTLPLQGFRSVDPREDGGVFVRYSGFMPPRNMWSASDPVGEIEFSSGDIVRGVLDGGSVDVLLVELLGGVRVEFSIDELAVVRFPARIARAGGATPQAADGGDRLYRVAAGGLDPIDGIVHGFERDGVSFESRGNTRKYRWSDVGALFVEALAPEVQPDERPQVVVDMYGSSRLRGALVELDEAGCRIATSGNPSLFLPANVIAEIAVDDGSYRFLSDMQPSDSGPQSPFGDDLGMVYPHRMDQSQAGAPLRSGGRTWTRGVGVHSPSRLTWTLDGGWAELQVAAGIDDEVLSGEHRGSVRFRVHVDGEMKFESGIVRGGDDVLKLPSIDLSGARELVFEVDAATEFHVGDRADWLRPILIRKP